MGGFQVIGKVRKSRRRFWSTRLKRTSVPVKGIVRCPFSFLWYNPVMHRFNLSKYFTINLLIWYCLISTSCYMIFYEIFVGNYDFISLLVILFLLILFCIEFVLRLLKVIKSENRMTVPQPVRRYCVLLTTVFCIGSLIKVLFDIPIGFIIFYAMD